MLMYMFHVAFGIGLIALVMGCMMCCKACCCKEGSCEKSGCHMKCCKFVGWIVVILAVISLFCTAMTGYKHMSSGMMDKPMHMMDKMHDNMKKEMGMGE